MGEVDTDSTTDSDEAVSTGRLWDVLRNRAFMRLWLVQALSQTGQNMVHFALLIVVGTIVTQHGIAQANTAFSLTVLSFSTPAILFSQIAGALVDRMNKRTVFVLTNLARGVAVVGFLVIQPGWPPLLALTAIYVITFASGTAGQVFGPALGATLPLLVPRKEFVQANALFNVTFTGAQVIGFAAAGPLLVKLLGTQPVFVGILAIFGLCVGLSFTLPSTPPPPRATVAEQSPVRQMVHDIREAIVFILQTPVLFKAIVYLSLATTSYLLVAVLGPDYVSGVLKLPQQDVAYLIAPAGIGVVLGVFVVGRFVTWFGAERVIDAGMIGGGTTLILLAVVEPLSTLFWREPGAASTGLIGIAVGLAGLLGLANALVLAPSQSLLQAGSPEHIRARVYATFFTVSNGAAFIPIIFAGAMADLFGVAKVIFALGAILVATGLVQAVRLAGRRGGRAPL